MCRHPVADDIGAVDQAVRWVGDRAAAGGLSEDVRYNIEVCLEEALANLVRHGRAVDGGKDIVVSFRAEPPGARLIVTDRCLPFDSVHEPAPAKPTREAPAVGGHGLRLLRAFSASLSYRRGTEGNALMLVFAPSSPTADGKGR